MKPYIFLLGILAIACRAQGQKIRFSDTSNKWTQIYLDWSVGMPAKYSYSAGSSYGADTIIAGQTYHQLFTQHTGNSIAIREDTVQGKVFFRAKGNAFPFDTSEHVLYDYTLRVGDTLKFDFSSQHFGFVVQDIDSVQMGGEYYRRWKVYPYTGLPPVHYLIEGIGSSYGPDIVSLAYSFESSFVLSCFTSKGLVFAARLRRHSTLLFVSRLPFSNSRYRRSSSTMTQAAILNTCLQSPLPELPPTKDLASFQIREGKMLCSYAPSP